MFPQYVNRLIYLRHVTDASAEQLLHNHGELVGQYERMYDNMVRINVTVSSLLTTVHLMQRHLDERINWFSTLLHMAGGYSRN